ncbi:MAG: hypothetical protein SVN78_10865, partial [Deferribacterota bacterium]|nr:hypothetical protein [Deferribacterota bacterium]
MTNKFINTYIYSAILISLLLTGCITVGPDYKEVDIKEPDKWQATLDRGLTDKKIDEARLDAWWETLNDKTLVKLEKLAAKGNIDVKIALSRIREERAMRGIEKARLFPTLNVSSTFEEREDSENLRNF